MPPEDASIHGIEMQFYSLVYQGALVCEGVRMRCGAVCYNRFK